VLAFGAVGMALSCATLVEIDPNECGNGVVESNEDCDSAARRAPTQGNASQTTVCAAPGQKNACRFTCEAAKDCPVGWGCDLNQGHCVSSASEFDLVDTLESGAVRMVKGDFDGDGRADLVLSQPSGLDGNSTATAYFFSEGMRVRSKTAIPLGVGALQTLPADFTSKALAKKAGTPFTSDGALFPISDLGFASSFGIGILRGAEDTTFVPELFPYQSLEVGIPGGRAIKASQILAIPRPPLNGSSRGQVSYYLAFPDLQKTKLVAFSLDKVADGKAVAAEELVGSPQDVRTVGAPGGQVLCFRAQPCGQVLAWSRSPQSNELILLDAPDPGGTPLPKAPRISIPSGIDSVAVGDVDGDGLYDIVIGPRGIQGSRLPYIVTGKNIRENRYTPEPVKPSQYPKVGEHPFVGLIDLNSDGLADFVYGNTVLASTRAGGDGGAGVGEWAELYRRTATAWSQIEHGDFDGDGRMDAILAVQGQAGIDVLRGTTGEIRPVTVPTPEPVDVIAAGFFDADRMIDVAYTTKVGRQNREAAAYILFGGPENQTVPVGRKNVSQLVNLRRPILTPVLPDVDFLGLVQDSEVVGGVKAEQAKAILYSTYTPQGRVPVSVLKRAADDGIAGRGVAFGQLAEEGRIDGLQVVVQVPSICTVGGKENARVQLVDDLLEPPGAGAGTAFASKAVGYGPTLPIALTAGRTGALDEAFAVTNEAGQIVIQRVVRRGVGAAAGIELTPLHRVPYAPGECKVPNSRTDALYPHEKLALLDLDDDGDLDLLFSDGGRFGPDPATNRGLLVVLRNDGNGTFVPLPTLVGRSFAKVRLGAAGPALAVLTPDEVVFYTLTGGQLTRLPAPILREQKTADAAAVPGPDARALESGDFDGDGVEDLAILAGGVLKIWSGRVAPAGGLGDGGAP
jgi:hypothetical protein